MSNSESENTPSRALFKGESSSLSACADTGSGNNFAPEALCKEKIIVIDLTNTTIRIPMATNLISWVRQICL